MPQLPGVNRGPDAKVRPSGLKGSLPGGALPVQPTEALRAD